MKAWPALLAVVIGLCVAAALIAANDVKQIATLLAGAGWGIVLVVALHLPQTLFSALGWRSLIDDPKRPRLSKLFEYRWIRESVNALLPVAQIGGDVVRARLLALKGVNLGAAAASCTVDLTVEMAAQMAFALLGLALLLVGPHGPEISRVAVGATLGGVAITASFMAAQRWGAFEAIGRWLVRVAERKNWSSLGDIGSLNERILSLYRSPRRLWPAGLHHLISWLLGTLETYAGLWVLGLHPGLREAAVIESLGQAVRGLGFMVPGALGVQEGGYILICALFGVTPQGALALSLVRRIRELALGVPGLIVWQRIEGRRSLKRAANRRIAVSQPMAGE